MKHRVRDPEHHPPRGAEPSSGATTRRPEGGGRLPSQRALALVAIGVLVVGAWALLVVAEVTGLDALIDHDVAVEAGLPGAPLFVAGWVAMIAAMMLPSVYPLVRIFDGTVSDRGDRGGLMARLLIGYLVVWTAAGVAAYLGDLVVHAIEDNTALLAGREWWLSAGIVALAGLFQFTPLKDRCLTACRHPGAFVDRHWRGREPRREALRLGVAHGRFCLGCCWALMLVMFAVSTANLAWMLMLGAVMTIEKTASWGRRAVPVAGGAAVVGALGIAVVHLI